MDKPPAPLHTVVAHCCFAPVRPARCAPPSLAAPCAACTARACMTSRPGVWQPRERDAADQGGRAGHVPAARGGGERPGRRRRGAGGAGKAWGSCRKCTAAHGRGRLKFQVVRRRGRRATAHSLLTCTFLTSSPLWLFASPLLLIRRSCRPRARPPAGMSCMPLLAPRPSVPPAAPG